jgi:rubrerythrin
MCQCKKAKFTKKEAEVKLKYLLEQGNFKDSFGRVYPCEICGYWHLTHHKREQAQILVSVKLSKLDKWKELLRL